MNTIHARSPRRARRGWRALAAALVAATLLAGSLAPASAAVFADWTRMNTVDAPRSSFKHHFYRGVPGQNQGQAFGGNDMTAVAADPLAQDEAATAYCADRFKSYDPASGTYLGYDGREHACP